MTTTLDVLADIARTAMRLRALNRRLTYRKGAFGRILAAGHDRLKFFNDLPDQFRREAIAEWLEEALWTEEIEIAEKSGIASAGHLGDC